MLSALYPSRYPCNYIVISNHPYARGSRVLCGPRNADAILALALGWSHKLQQRPIHWIKAHRFDGNQSGKSTWYLNNKIADEAARKAGTWLCTLSKLVASLKPTEQTVETDGQHEPEEDNLSFEITLMTRFHSWEWDKTGSDYNQVVADFSLHRPAKWPFSEISWNATAIFFAALKREVNPEFSASILQLAYM